MSDHTDDQGQRLEALYHTGRKLSPEERDAFVQREAGHDPVLMEKLRALFLLPGGFAVDPLGDRATESRPVSGLVDDRTHTLNSPSHTEPFDLKLDMEFGRCRIVMQRGAGGMGAVYLATDLENNNRPVALKVMKPTLLSELDRQRFHNETAALSRLEHPNIARLYFKGIQQWQGADRPYFVMEYVDGVTLDEYCQNNPLTKRQLLELLRKICLAVHHGHLKGVFHRDLKPSNILVTKEGEPKIIDFGVSFMVSDDSASGESGKTPEKVGTLKYMAPETAGATEHALDARTDVYSLGIIAFELLAGRRPRLVLPTGDLLSLEGSIDGQEMMWQISQCEREKLGDANRKLRGDLELVIAKALRLKMDQRYTDASELAEDFRRLFDLEPIKARPASTAYHAWLFVRRNRFATAASAAIFLLILIAAIGFRAAYISESIHLNRESADLKIRTEQRDKIQQDDAEAHFRFAQLAEQRGNWSAAAAEYHAAEGAHYFDRLNLAIGQLRALGRLDNRSADAAALIHRVHDTMPDIAQSPQFQVVEGFVYWSSKPEESLGTIRQALVHADQLTPADRAYAEALTTDDIKTAVAKLQVTLETDTFNRDAWASRTLCDLLLVKLQNCESDAGVLHRLDPQDGVGTLLAALASALQGRQSAAIEYLDGDVNIPAELRAILKEDLAIIGQIHSLDDARSLPWETTLKLAWDSNALINSGRLNLQSNLNKFAIPLSLQQIFGQFKLKDVERTFYAPILDPDDTEHFPLDALEFWPNGNGDWASGWLAMFHNDYASAIQHFHAATTAPSLIDCHRSAAVALANARCRNIIAGNTSLTEGTPLVKADIDKVISYGGVYPDKFNEETVIVENAATLKLYPQVSTLADLWHSHAPDDARAMYYVAVADSHLDERDLALIYYKRAVAKGLPGDLRSKAKTAIAELTASAATRPTTMPR